MNEQTILAHTDHTLLKQTATWQEIKALCDEGIAYGVASVCIPPCYVAQARAYLQGRLPICTVIGFPNGSMTTAAKVFEAKDAVAAGADEIDMVINIGWVKDANYNDVQREIEAVRAACQGKLLKVIIEACLLSDEEKIELCRVVSESGADFIKTSTGFSTGGATAEDIRLFAAHKAEHLKIKAAGGIKSLADAELFLSLGASRLGSSSVVRLVQQARENNAKGETEHGTLSNLSY